MEGSDRARAIVTRWTRALAVERAAQVEQLVCATELVDAYARVEPSVVPGAERLVPSGAAGTPLVAEFVAAELAPLLGESIPTAWARLRDAVNLRHRHPILWQATLAGVVPTWQARRVAQACAELGVDAAWWVDAYEIPTQVARHVRVRDSFSCFPYSGSRARADLDHTEPFRARGPSRQTRASNLAPLARREHRAKTFGWIARQPAPRRRRRPPRTRPLRPPRRPTAPRMSGRVVPP